MNAEIEASPSRGSLLVTALAPYALLRDNTTLRVLLACHLVSRTVQWMYLLALFVVGYNLTHSPRTVALLTFVRFLPNALLLPVSGALTDHMNPKVLMIVSNAGRAVCVAGLLFVHSSAMLPLAYMLLFIATIFSSLFRPSLMATLPSVIDERRVMSANTLVSQVEMISLGVGPALGGILVMAGPVDTSFVVASTVFVMCAITLALLPIPERPPGGAKDTGWIEHLGGGFNFLFRQHRGILLGYSVALGGMQLLDGAAWTLSVVLSEQVFGFGGQGAGFLNAAYGAGGFVGGLIMGPVLARRRYSVLFAASIVASCAFATLYGFSPIGAFALLFNLGTGAADILSKVTVLSVIQAATPNHMIGRVFGAFESLLIFAQLLGSITVGAVLSFLSPPVANFAFCVVGLAVLLLCTPLLKRTESELGSRIFLRSVPALQPVTFHLLDDLAQRVRVESFSHGSSIVREGETGTALYIIKRGVVDVVVRGGNSRSTHIATLTTMDYFGELALLHNAPRSATVVARGAVDVYRLEGADFQMLLRRVDGLRLAINAAGADRDLNRESRLLAGM